MRRVGILLITAALITGMVGCVPTVTLTITSTPGGAVVEPGEGTFTYYAGTEVDLVAEADEGYYFAMWTGDEDTVDDADAIETTIAMNYDYSITANFVPVGGEPVWDWYDLDGVRDNLGDSYILMNDLDSTTAGYEELASLTADEGKGWQPIGSTTQPFTGHFDGREYEIYNLFINRPEKDSVGLFGSIDEGGFVGNIGVLNASVLGHDDVGSLVGDNYGIVRNCYATSNISSGRWDVGGLVGSNRAGTVVDSYSDGSVIGKSGVGGLVGFNYDTVRNSHSSANVTGTIVGGLVGYNGEGIVSNSYSTGSVTGDESVYGLGEVVGGLVARNHGDITSSYSTSTVTGDIYIGGLVGQNSDTVNNSYSTGSVTGDRYIGGLVATNHGDITSSYSTSTVTGDNSVGGLVGANDGTVRESYSRGSVAGRFYVGGLMGWNVHPGTVINSYSTGSVTGDHEVGGLVGLNVDDGTVSNCFWDTETSGQSTSDGGTGKTTTEMQDIDTFSGATWDIVAVVNSSTRNPVYLWNIVDDEIYPFLSWQP